MPLCLSGPKDIYSFFKRKGVDLMKASYLIIEKKDWDSPPDFDNLKSDFDFAFYDGFLEHYIVEAYGKILVYDLKPESEINYQELFDKLKSELFQFYLLYNKKKTFKR